VAVGTGTKIHGMRILVAEDDKVMSQLLCSTMMAAIRNPVPDLIVLDLQMPAGDGPTTLAKLKASSRTALIPVVVVSASQDLKVRESVRALGAVTFIEKPIKPDHFLEVIEVFGRKKG
jgi:CheY-like chemotaxis protein